MNLRVGELVINRTSRKKGKVIEVDNYWGWYVVEYEDGYKKRYEGNMKDHEATMLQIQQS